MSAITVQWLMDFESRMRLIQSETYSSLVAAENQWWGDITKVSTTGGLRELFAWVLSTARLSDAGELGGNVNFQDMAMLETDFRVRFANAGLELFKSQMLDQDANGLQIAAAWTRQVTAMAAYWPQTQVVNLLKNGATATYNSYDDVTFFNATHYNNPKATGAGSYSNTHVSVPIDTSVSAEVALQNLSTVRSRIASIKQPNGVDPRFLKPHAIICSSALYPRVVQLTDAKFIAATGGAGVTGGTSDVEGLIRSLGYGKVIEAPELNGWGSDTTYFVVAKPAGVPDDELSGFVYLEREPFTVRYYTGDGGGAGTDAILQRTNKYEWNMEGRNVAGYGHPYLIHRCQAGA